MKRKSIVVVVALLAIAYALSKPSLLPQANELLDSPPPHRSHLQLADARFVKTPEPRQYIEPKLESRRAINDETAVSSLIARELRITVIGPRGEIIPNARVRMKAEDEFVLIGRTGPMGLLDASVSTDVVELIVDAEHYSPSTEVISEDVFVSPAPSVVIELGAAVEMNGSVRWVDGGSVGAGIHVLVWTAGRRPEIEDIYGAVQGIESTRYQVALTDDQGNFRVPNLKAERSYTVTVAGRGGVCLKRKTLLVSAEFVELEILPVYGAIVELVGPMGERPTTSPLVYGRGRFYGCDEDPDAYLIRGKLLELALALEGAEQLEGLDRNRTLLVYGHKSQVGIVGPIRFEADVPGYEPIWTNVFADPIEKRIPEYRLELSQRAEGWGAVSIYCSGISRYQGAGGEGNRVLGKVSFRNEPTGAVFTISATEAMWSAPQLIEGVPSGLYGVSLTLEDSRGTYPPRDAPPISVQVLGQNRVESISFSATDAGAAMVLMQAHDGQVYDGYVVFALMSIDSDGRQRSSSFVEFESSPYVFPALPEGHYSLGIERFEGQIRMEFGLVTFDVIAGELAVVDLSVD